MRVRWSIDEEIVGAGGELWAQVGGRFLGYDALDFQLTAKLGLLAKEDKPEEVRRILKTRRNAKMVREALDKFYRDNKHTSEVYKKIKPLVGK